MVQKGTGVWGSELDHSPLFIIAEVCIDRDWRRKGVGKRIVTCLIEKSRAGKRSPAFSLVAPGWLNREIEPDIQGKTELEKQQTQLGFQKVATSLYRSLGFRRIGASSFFGLATDPSHPAHTIPSIADFDPIEAEPDVDEDPKTETSVNWFGDSARSSWRLKLLQERLPLQHAAITLPDEECVEFFHRFKISNASMDDWGKVDRFSKNVLHVAACEFKVKVFVGCWKMRMKARYSAPLERIMVTLHKKSLNLILNSRERTGYEQLIYPTTSLGSLQEL